MKPALSFRHSMPYYAISITVVEILSSERWTAMEPNQQVETEELVAEILVEEVSIDGMCGVY
jgi:mycofactocin precursor